MIITINGVPGSGKTTVAKLLSKHLGVPFYSMGDFRGRMALERGLTIDQLNALGETERFTDADVDDYQKKLGESGESFVAEGRLSWHFIPHSFKVFIDADPAVAAHRIFDAQKKGERTDETTVSSAQDVQTRIAERVASDVKRYQLHYGLNFQDKSKYDLVIDSTRLTPDQVMRTILNSLPQPL